MRSSPTSVMGTRIGAYLIDVLIGVVFGAVVGHGMWQHAQVADASAYCQGLSGVWCIPTSSTTAIVATRSTLIHRSLLPSAGFFVFNMVLLEGLVGGTMGKLAVGLRVVNKDGRRAGLLRALVRNLLLIIDALCFAIVGLLTSCLTSDHQRVGDMVAGTYVVRRSSVGSPIHQMGWSPPFAPVPVGGYAAYGAIPAPMVAPVSAPTWDVGRNAYVQYDQAQSAWVQWDDGAQQWVPMA